MPSTPPLSRSPSAESLNAKDARTSDASASTSKQTAGPPPFTRSSPVVDTAARSGTASPVTIRPLNLDDPRLLDQVSTLALSMDRRNLSEEQCRSGAFLTLPPTFGPAMLSLLANQAGVVALDDAGKPAGFMLSSKPVANSPSAWIQALGTAFRQSAHGHLDWVIYGPVGVGADHRGQGVAPQMFARLSEQLRSAGKEAMVGFVDLRNQPSLGLHAKLGFEKIGEFAVGEQRYAAIMYRLRPRD